MKVLVCGGRDLQDQGSVFDALDAIHRERHIAVVIHGAAEGADGCADEWAFQRRVQRSTWPAPWPPHGTDRSAGPRRNAAMLLHMKPDLVIAFPGGRGTADMVAKARAAGVEVREVPA